MSEHEGWHLLLWVLMMLWMIPAWLLALLIAWNSQVVDWGRFSLPLGWIFVVIAVDIILALLSCYCLYLREQRAQRRRLEGAQ